MSLSEILSERKAIDILLMLWDKPNNIRGLHKNIGGSLSTIVERVNSLIQKGLIMEAEGIGPGKFLELTERGKGVVAICKWMDVSAPTTKPVIDEPKKWILLLLHTLREIKGSTRLEKLLFLLKEKFKVVDEIFYQFQPYLFGPFSAQILEDAKALQAMGLLEIDVEVGVKGEPFELSDAIYIRKTYKLTRDGEEQAKKFYEEIVSRKANLGEALFHLREYNAMPLSNLLSYVYKEFPYYGPPPDLP